MLIPTEQSRGFMQDICNYYEQLVLDKLWQMANESEKPYSQSFLEDVACLALNKLPTCYVRSLVDKGANMTELDHLQVRAAVDHAIDQALIQVQLHPRTNRDA